jgi:tRNA(Ile)-lysidine synthase
MSANPAARPIDDPAFAAAMAPAEPFEANPEIAVALSGGPDSLALLLLAERWARARGGRVVALTVDHGLRPESADEAARVAGWMRRLGAEHRVLPWPGAKPATGVMARARVARYRLLLEACRSRGALHLLLGHHRDDQAETFLMRLKRGSRFDGLAAMPAVLEGAHARLIRPLLGFAKEELIATLRAAGQDWIEDASNRDPRFARPRLRALMPALAEAGLDAAALAATAARFRRARAALEEATARALARAVRVHPAGFAWLDAGMLTEAPAEIGLRALARVLMAIGGRAYPPGAEPLERLLAALAAGRPGGAATLAGCRVERIGAGILICREVRRAARVPVEPGARLLWDNRFAIELTPAGGARRELSLGALGSEGWRAVVADRPVLRGLAMPWPARIALPALWDEAGVRHVPHINYDRADAPPSPAVAAIAFRPRQGLSGARFLSLELPSDAAILS